MIERRQPEVTYEFIEQADVEQRLRHAYEILTNPDVECTTGRSVVPSDEIGESDCLPNIHIQRNTPTPTADPSSHRAAYERR